MDQAVQQLIDRQAIADLMQRYARTLDWLDDDGQAGCYWPDAEIDYGFFRGRADDFLPVVMATERGSDRRWHMLGAPLVSFTAPDIAEAETYGVFAGATRQEDGTLAGNLFGGRYLDRFERRGGEWRVAKRLYVLDWCQRLADQPGFDADPAFPLPVLKIDRSGHELYRPM